MNTISIRLDDDVREFYESAAKAQGLRPTQLIRSILVQLHRHKSKQEFSESISVGAFKDFQETIPLAAEDLAPREDGQ